MLRIKFLFMFSWYLPITNARITPGGNQKLLKNIQPSDTYSKCVLTILCSYAPYLLHHFTVDNILTHWGRVTDICFGSLTIIGSNNGLSPGRRQAIIWTNAGILLIWPWGTNFSEILIEINTFSFNKMHLKMSSGIWQPFVSASMS